MAERDSKPLSPLEQLRNVTDMLLSDRDVLQLIDKETKPTLLKRLKKKVKGGVASDPDALAEKALRKREEH